MIVMQLPGNVYIAKSPSKVWEGGGGGGGWGGGGGGGGGGKYPLPSPMVHVGQDKG